MMSDMRTFTVRDLDRNPQAVLQACDSEGAARIRCRDGRTYLIRQELPHGKAPIVLPDFSARLAELFPTPLPPEFSRQLDQAIGGE